MRLTFMLTLLPVLALCSPAMAQNLCGDRENTVKTLKDKFFEQPVGLGLMSSRAVIELLVSKSGTWTLLATRSDGKTCFVGAGTDWQSQTIPKFDPKFGEAP